MKRGFWLPAVEVCALSSWIALECWGWWKLSVLPSDGDLALFLGALVGAWILADLSSGIVHFAADTLGDAHTPLLGRTLIAPFREHHNDPQAMLAHGFMERNGNSALIGLFPLLWTPFAQAESIIARGLFIFCLLLSAWVLLTNQIHAWAHQAQVPLWVRLLQRAGVFLSREEHGKHHSAFEGTDSPTPTHYCITSGFTNPLVNHLTEGPRGQGTSAA